MSDLIKFWVKRFVFIFALAMAALGLVEWTQRGSEAEIGSVVLWSGLAALIAASVSTYWMYKRSCPVRP